MRGAEVMAETEEDTETAANVVCGRTDGTTHPHHTDAFADEGTAR